MGKRIDNYDMLGKILIQNVNMTNIESAVFNATTAKVREKVWGIPDGKRMSLGEFVDFKAEQKSAEELEEAPPERKVQGLDSPRNNQ